MTPFTFGDEPANAGDTVTVICAVTKGDLPVEIVWMFDGKVVSRHRGDVTVSKSGKKSKQLSIEAVTAQHAGEYTCVASNLAGSTSRSAVLEVNGTPVVQTKLELGSCLPSTHTLSLHPRLFSFFIFSFPANFHLYKVERTEGTSKRSRFHSRFCQ